MGNPLAQLRNSQEENLQVKAEETPIELNQQENKSVLIKKDLDARWTKKRIKKITTATKATSTTIKDTRSSRITK